MRVLVGSPSTFGDAVSALLPVSSAAIATYVVMQAGGASLAPLALLGSHAQRALLSCSEGCATKLVLEAICALPDALRASVGGPVFLEPAKAVLSNAPRQLLEAARGNARQEQALRSLGYRLGVTQFIEALSAALHEAREERPVAVVLPASAEVASGNGEAKRGHAEAERNSADAASSKSTTELRADETALTATLPLTGVPAVDGQESMGTGGGGSMEATRILCARVAQKFGGGLESQLDVQGQGALSELREVTVRAIHRLAGELYAGNVHFVLELIQNADDNSYQLDRTPTLRMVATASKLLFVNNENGFSEKDCLALCSIGSSTKKASDAGYIVRAATFQHASMLPGAPPLPHPSSL